MSRIDVGANDRLPYNPRADDLSRMASVLLHRIDAHNCRQHKEIIWLVKDIFLFPSPSCITPSTDFQFAGLAWRLELRSPMNANSSLLLLNWKCPQMSTSSPVRIRWNIGVRFPNGVPYMLRCGEDTLSESTATWKYIGPGCEIARSEFLELRNSLCPLGQITMFCFLSIEGSATAEASTQTRSPGPGIGKLVSDLKGLLASGENSDVTINVRGTVFRAHRVILSARVPVFLAMFQHQMMESITGNVRIDDCEPDTFWRFLNYIYTGNMQEGSDEDINSLYRVADKYQLDALKQECAIMIQSSMTVDTFCNVANLALRHHDVDLLKQVISFLSVHAKEVVMTDAWRYFMNANPHEANELLVSAILPSKE